MNLLSNLYIILASLDLKVDWQIMPFLRIGNQQMSPLSLSEAFPLHWDHDDDESFSTSLAVRKDCKTYWLKLTLFLQLTVACQSRAVTTLKTFLKPCHAPWVTLTPPWCAIGRDMIRIPGKKRSDWQLPIASIDRGLVLSFLSSTLRSGKV